MSYETTKTELRYTEENLKVQLKELEAKEFLLKTITELSRNEDDYYEHNLIDSIYTASAHSRVLHLFDIDYIKANLKLASKLDFSTVQTSLKEKLAIIAYKKDLKKIRIQTNSYKNNTNTKPDAFKFLDSRVKIVDSFVNYCLEHTKGLSIQDQKSFVEQNFEKLLDAQKKLDGQVHQKVKSPTKA